MKTPTFLAPAAFALSLSACSNNLNGAPVTAPQTAYNSADFEVWERQEAEKRVRVSRDQSGAVLALGGGFPVVQGACEPSGTIQAQSIPVVTDKPDSIPPVVTPEMPQQQDEQGDEESGDLDAVNIDVLLNLKKTGDNKKGFLTKMRERLMVQADCMIKPGGVDDKFTRGIQFDSSDVQCFKNWREACIAAIDPEFWEDRNVCVDEYNGYVGHMQEIANKKRTGQI